MELTVKAKEQFEEWFNKNSFDEEYNNWVTYKFEKMHPSMKWGVYQDFADSLGIEIYAEKSLCREVFVSLTDSYPCGYFKTRPEARKAAIEKLNELLKELQN